MTESHWILETDADEGFLTEAHWILETDADEGLLTESHWILETDTDEGLLTESHWILETDADEGLLTESHWIIETRCFCESFCLSANILNKKKDAHFHETSSLCGDGEIRTRDTVSRIHTFQACSFSHSDTSPFYWVANVRAITLN